MGLVKGDARSLDYGSLGDARMEGPCLGPTTWQVCLFAKL